MTRKRVGSGPARGLLRDLRALQRPRRHRPRRPGRRERRRQRPDGGTGGSGTAAAAAAAAQRLGGGGAGDGGASAPPPAPAAATRVGRRGEAGGRRTPSGPTAGPDRRGGRTRRPLRASRRPSADEDDAPRTSRPGAGREARRPRLEPSVGREPAASPRHRAGRPTPTPSEPADAGRAGAEPRRRGRRAAPAAGAADAGDADGARAGAAPAGAGTGRDRAVAARPGRRRRRAARPSRRPAVAGRVGAASDAGRVATRRPRGLAGRAAEPVVCSLGAPTVGVRVADCGRSPRARATRRRESEFHVYAIVRAGGRQEKVAVGDVLDHRQGQRRGRRQLELTAAARSSTATTVTSDAGKLAKVTVTAEVVKPAKGPKITHHEVQEQDRLPEASGSPSAPDPGQDHRHRRLSGLAIPADSAEGRH